MTELEQATYETMAASSVEDWAAHARHTPSLRANLPDRLMTMLRDLDRLDDGAPISGYAHSLQSATLAYDDGADDETVFSALFHDIGQDVSVDNHSQVAAAIIRPYVSEPLYWIVSHHGIFQGYYYFHHVGEDPLARDAYIDSPHYQACVDWCDRYDQRAFQRNYPTKPLEFFEPMVRRVMAAAS
ncbi:MAG: HD domain-containing protein [Chromatiales bacterium]|nr:HD domain-containing protein [Chromatiales bacterium]